MSKAKSNERREKLEQVRREQQAAERKRNLLFGGIGAAAALAIIGGSVYAVQQVEANKPENRELASFGVVASEANCDDIVRTPASAADINNHVPPVDGNGQPTVVQYSTTPPVFGPHFAAPAPFERAFYTERDRPAMETLVHNLEHGYVMVWYDESLGEDDRTALEGAVENLRSRSETQKIIASAWDSAYGELPEGKVMALSHWGTEQGSAQYCGSISGQAIGAFAEEHPPSLSPEPFGA